jgi:microcystin degradation protein MlrC
VSSQSPTGLAKSTRLKPCESTGRRLASEQSSWWSVWVFHGCSIADPTDAGMIDVFGFDTAAPAFMSDFAADRF